LNWPWNSIVLSCRREALLLILFCKRGLKCGIFTRLCGRKHLHCCVKYQNFRKRSPQFSSSVPFFRTLLTFDTLASPAFSFNLSKTQKYLFHHTPLPTISQNVILTSSSFLLAPAIPKRETLDIEAEQIRAALPAEGITSTDLLALFKIKTHYTPEAQKEFITRVKDVSSMGLDKKLRPKPIVG